MIDKEFWINIAENWRIKDEIDVPDVIPIEVKVEDLDDDISDEEVDDILADLGFDDI